MADRSWTRLLLMPHQKMEWCIADLSLSIMMKIKRCITIFMRGRLTILTMVRGIYYSAVIFLRCGEIPGISLGGEATSILLRVQKDWVSWRLYQRRSLGYVWKLYY